MTTVYVTQTGSRYHARTDLKCMENAHGFTAVDPSTAAAGGLLPCLTCDAPPLPDSSEGDHRWLRAIDDWNRAGLFESFWEQAFARRVLARTPGLSADDTEVQAYISGGTETYKVDFHIPKAGLVLEVDGYAKDGTPPTPSDMEKRNRRDAALQSQGFKVLHFLNAQVQQEPDACRDQVATSLAVKGPKLTKAPDPVAPTASPPVAVVLPTSAAPVATTAPAMPTTNSPMVTSGNSRTALWLGLGLAATALIAIVLIVAGANSSSTDANTTGSISPAQPTSQPTLGGSSLPTNGVCPTAFPFKGNINDNDERIVHAPGQQFYDRVNPEQCFVSVAAAQTEGYRASER